MTSALDRQEESAAGDPRREPEVEEAFDRLVSEGHNRLARPLIPLMATGFVGGIDVGVGVLAYLVVYHQTGQPLLAAAAFPIGFIALLLARSELFTENFLVPVTAWVAGRGSWPQLVRLWLVTLAANLLGGLVMAGMIVVALPELRSTAAELGRHYATLGVSWRSFLLAVLAGVVITLLTRMQHATDDLGPKLVAGVAMSFVLPAAQLFHSVLDSILMFTGLLGGHAAYTWADWALALGWSAFGNLVGGIGLVTSIRLFQTPHRVAEERAGNSAPSKSLSWIATTLTAGVLIHNLAGAGRWAVMEGTGSPDPRDESREQRDDRNLAELLQELRVAGLGVQVLFGFLLSLPFTNRFTKMSPGQRDLYLASLVLAAVATALLLGPVAYHRLVFRRGMKEGLVRAASVMAIIGLAVVGLAVSVSVLLVTSFVASGLTAGLITALVACMFGLLWFAFPLARRR